jgi:hypothetical protein
LASIALFGLTIREFRIIIGIVDLVRMRIYRCPSTPVTVSSSFSSEQGLVR